MPLKPVFSEKKNIQVSETNFSFQLFKSTFLIPYMLVVRKIWEWFQWKIQTTVHDPALNTWSVISFMLILATYVDIWSLWTCPQETVIFATLYKQILIFWTNILFRRLKHFQWAVDGSGGMNIKFKNSDKFNEMKLFCTPEIKLFCFWDIKKIHTYKSYENKWSKFFIWKFNI